MLGVTQDAEENPVYGLVRYYPVFDIHLIYESDELSVTETPEDIIRAITSGCIIRVNVSPVQLMASVCMAGMDDFHIVAGCFYTSSITGGIEAGYLASISWSSDPETGWFIQYNEL